MAAQSNGDDSDTIHLAATTYHASDIGGAFTFTGANFANSLTLVGAGRGLTILDGDKTHPVMHLQMQSNNSLVTVQGITFQNGKGNGGPAGLDLSSTEGDTTVEDCEFKDNLNGVDAGGAGISASGAIFFRNNFVTGNSSGSGGGVTIDNFNGGGPASTHIINNVMSGNSATGDGGGILVVVQSQISAIQVINNSFTGNSANTGGAFCTGGTSGVLALNLYNNIAFGNTAGALGLGPDIFVDDVVAIFEPTISVFNNDLGEICKRTGGCGLQIADNQAGNIEEDPLFVNATTGDLRVRVGSPVVDKGIASAPDSPAEDIVGNPRNAGAAPDMGAFEAAPILAVAPNPVDFGTADLSQVKTLIMTLNNAGNGVLNIASLTLSDTAHFSLNLNGGATPCGSAAHALNGGQACTMGLDFISATAGSFNGSLTVVSDDSKFPSLAVSLLAQAQQGGGGGGGGCALGAGSSSLALGWLAPLFGYFLIRKRRQG